MKLMRLLEFQLIVLALPPGRAAENSEDFLAGMVQALVPEVDKEPDAPPILTLSVPPPWPMVATRMSIYCAPLTFTSSGTVVALVTGATGTRLAVAKVEVTRVP